MNLAELVQQAESVFVLPDSVTQLKECIEDPASNLDDVAEIIAFDPSLTTQLLKIANSAFYRFPHSIDTVTKAIQVIGTKATYDLVLSYGVSHTFKEIDASVIDMDRFWEQSVSCALLSKYFADQKRIRGSETLFVTGLLHNVGELAMVKLQPDIARQCATLSPDITPSVIQQRTMGFTYADFSASLIEHWGLPESIYGPISTIFSNVSGMDVANQIIKLSYELALDNVNADIYGEQSHVTGTLISELGLSDDDVTKAVDETNIQVLSVIQLFNPNAFNIF
ncbi:HDOD domain-containing protein [Aestuariibacter sp. GS-14]|uniref:HDOD domain-containing protein n=1 Tax=Aestuariibacter sp. GS-14 TaxID=2590670 RepID=UPI0011264B92|nr:HDOD domain-containing protein [Aestuariibacter sp. GS-14]TPV60783.1 HDOD domain-containing protein [Aestuariibacter sp. GS-14]